MSDKKILAQKLKQKLNSPQYVEVPDLLAIGDYGSDLDFYEGIPIRQRRGFTDKKEEPLIYQNQLEPVDWTKITNLIKITTPVLDTFPYEKVGFYLVKTDKPIERNDGVVRPWSDGGETNPSNFNKWVEVDDKIIITPYQTRDVKDKKMIGICNKCGVDYRKIESWYYAPINWNGKEPSEKLDGWFCGDCWRIEEKNYRQRSSRKNTAYKSEPRKSNLGDEHYYYFENGRWISLESGTPDPNTSSAPTPKRKSECDTCHRKLGREHRDFNNFYIMKRYHGQVNIGWPVIWACSECYLAKKQEYLQNYETIFEHYLDKNNEVDFHRIKFSFIDCYAGKKDQDGKVLKQENCSHCQPWKKFETAKTNEKEFINWLIQYFQSHKLQRIELKNGKLVETYNNNNN